MKIVWNPADTGRAFFAPSIRAVTHVSSNLSEGAGGVTLGGCLTVVADANARFCDLEVQLPEELRATEPVVVSRDERLREPLQSNLCRSARVTWFLDDSGSLSLQLVESPHPERRWFSWESGELLLAVDPSATVEALVLRGIVTDPDGALESAWLREVEARCLGEP